jgi:SPP1 gp7 family putative phage head morphogenesis protein
MDSANEDLLNRIIQRSVRLERLKKGEARWIGSLIDGDLQPEILALIRKHLPGAEEAGYVLDQATRAELSALDRAVSTLIKAKFVEYAAVAKVRMERLAGIEAKWMAGAIKGSGPAVLGNGRFAVVQPAAQTLKSISTARPFQGRVMRQWYKDLGESSQRGVRDAVRMGMTNSETTGDIVRRIRGTFRGKWKTVETSSGALKRVRNFEGGVLSTTTKQAEAIATTATNHVSNHAREALYAQNDSLIKAVRWVSTLDAVTSLLCISLDGQEFEPGEGPRPPAHFGCRSSTMPLLVSWRELGIDADDMTPSERASMNGFVPGGVSYGDWLKGQEPGFQNEVLGPARAELFRGGLDVGKFSAKDLSILTLDQLEVIS